MSRFIAWFRRKTATATCAHDWETIGDVLSPCYDPRFKCRKCGKEEGL